MDAAPTALPPSSLSAQLGRARADNRRVQIRNSIGPPVEGENFFNRDADQARLWSRLETDDVLLLAPRRVGKTSLLFKLDATAEQHGFKPIYVSVASHSTEVAFLRALIEAIAVPGRLGGRMVSRASKLLGRIRSLSVSEVSVEIDAQRWQDTGEDFLRLLQASKQRCLIMLDELPIFVLNLLRVHGRERARLFLTWFRDVRIDRRARLVARWLICGSIGLDTVTQRERLGDTINDLAIVRLDAFSRSHARALLEELARKALLEAAAQDSNGAPTEALRELMRSRGANHDVQRYILDVLVNDGYLVNVENRWRFRSPLLRDYWRSMVQ